MVKSPVHQLSYIKRLPIQARFPDSIEVLNIHTDIFQLIGTCCLKGAFSTPSYTCVFIKAHRDGGGDPGGVPLPPLHEGPRRRDSTPGTEYIWDLF